MFLVQAQPSLTQAQWLATRAVHLPPKALLKRSCDVRFHTTPSRQLSGLVVSWTAAFPAFLWQCASIWLQPEMPAVQHQLEPLDPAPILTIASRHGDPIFMAAGGKFSAMSFRFPSTEPYASLQQFAMFVAAVAGSADDTAHRPVALSRPGAILRIYQRIDWHCHYPDA